MQVTKKQIRKGSEPCRNLCKLNVNQTHKDVYNQIHSGTKQLLHAESPALRRRGHGPRRQAALKSGGR